jgi:hypothetical protein
MVTGQAAKAGYFGFGAEGSFNSENDCMHLVKREISLLTCLDAHNRRMVDSNV